MGVLEPRRDSSPFLNVTVYSQYIFTRQTRLELGWSRATWTIFIVPRSPGDFTYCERVEDQASWHDKS